MSEMDKLKKKMKYLHLFANWVITPLVVIFIVVYFMTKPISVWDIILAVLVVLFTVPDFILVIVYSRKYKKLSEEEGRS